MRYLALSFAILTFAGCAASRHESPSWLAQVMGRDDPRGTSKSKEVSKKDKQLGLLLARGRLCETEDDWTGAARAYRRILDEAPEHRSATYRLAVVCSKQGRLDEADELYQRAIQQQPDNAEIRCDLGYNCYLLEQWDEAEQHYKHALHLNPGCLRARTNLGTLLARRGRLDEAFAEFSQSGCTGAEAKSNLAFAQLLENRYSEARDLYEEALTENPQLGRARRGIAAVDHASVRSGASDAQAVATDDSTPPILAAMDTVPPIHQVEVTADSRQTVPLIHEVEVAADSRETVPLVHEVEVAADSRETVPLIHEVEVAADSRETVPLIHEVEVNADHRNRAFDVQAAAAWEPAETDHVEPQATRVRLTDLGD
jgi:Flp pilus assembly protein TadD